MIWAILRLLLCAFLLTLLFWTVLRYLGDVITRKDYEKDYDKLAFYVKHSIVSAGDYWYIRNKFESISKYQCKDREKLAVLEAEFYRKFAGVKVA